jgi:hypothetical protein
MGKQNITVGSTAKEDACLVAAGKQRKRAKGVEIPISLQGYTPGDLTSPTRPHLLRFYHLRIAPQDGNQTFNKWAFEGHLSKPCGE